VERSPWAPALHDYSAVKIATFNINNVRRRLPNLLAWLASAEPDVVCLQELKTLHELFPQAELQRAGYASAWVGQKTWNGVAILVRGEEPTVTRRALPGDSSDTQSRYIEAAVDGILIGCLYAPNGNPQPGPKFDYKLAWLDRLNRYAETLMAQDVPVVLAGDYNVVPTPSDIYQTTSYDKDALVQPASRERYAALVAQGWTDSLRALHPDEPMYTFWDYMRMRWPRNAGLRIDHLLLSPGLADRLVAAGVDRAVRGEPGASDHAPAWIQLRKTAAKKRSPSESTRKAVSRPRRAAAN
jgi:exodeoxyribonuclease-3